MNSNGINTFENDNVFILTTALLIFFGGLGFITVYELFNRSRNIFWKINIKFHSGLFLVGTGFIYLFEVLKNKDNIVQGKLIINSIFLSASARSGGMSLVDLNTLTDSSILLIMWLMFIGGASISAAGGIRLTTFAVIVAEIVSMIKGRKYVFLEKKSIKEEIVKKSFVILAIFLMLVFVSTLLLSIFENANLIKIVFEVVSALTNTGLSMGITEQLTWMSKIILIFLMILGRVGILGFVYLFYKEETSKIKYLDEDLIIG